MGKLLEAMRRPNRAITPSPLDDHPPAGIIRTVNRLRNPYDDSPTMTPDRLYFAAPPQSKGIELPYDALSVIQRIVGGK